MSYLESPISELSNVARLAFQNDSRINACFVCKTRPAEPFRIKDLHAGHERSKDLIGLCRFHETKFRHWLEQRPASAPLLVRWLERRHPERAEVLRRRWQKRIIRKRPTKRTKWLSLTEEQRHRIALNNANGF